MRRLLGVPLVAVVLLASPQARPMPATAVPPGIAGARACCCGECGCSAQCCTVMKTCREIVYEQRSTPATRPATSGSASRRRSTA